MRNTILILVALGGMLAGAVWMAWDVWWSVEEVAETSIGAHGFIAMGLGVGLSILVGAGLMALLFYSARHGHDDVDHDA